MPPPFPTEPAHATEAVPSSCAYDDVVTRFRQTARPQWTLRFSGLLVSGLLLGLLGMHGLGAIPESHATGHDRMVAAAPMAATASMPDACEHDEGGCGGHTDHADPTCATASVAGAPAMPALLPDTVTSQAPPGLHASPGSSGPEGGRAPPSLSELQLLRI